jgi:hypothetical protein
VAAASGSAMAQNNPLAGTWNFVPEKSQFMPGPGYKSITLTVQASGDPVMTFSGVDAGGKPFRVIYDAVPDGKSHIITGMQGGYDTGTWTTRSDTVVSYQYNNGRRVAVLGVRTLSADGKSMTFQEKTYDNNGKQTGTQLLVFENPNAQVASLKPEDNTPPPPKPIFTPEEMAALDALSANKDDDAIRLFTGVINAKPPTPMLYYDYGSRGIAYLRKGQKDQALADFDAAIKLKSDDGDSRFRRGALKFEQMQYQAAIDDLTVAVQADPMNADAFNIRSFAYYRLQQTDKGAADTEKACALKKEYCVN